MSSITAAPRIIRLTSRLSSPICPSTRAVIPTEVATIDAPTKIDSIDPAPHASMTAHPRMNGTITPKTATASALPPTRKMSAGRVPNPTRKSRNMTPISASASVSSSGATSPSSPGPIRMPARISPATAGWRSRSKSSAASLAATKMMKSRSNRPLSTAMWAAVWAPVWAPVRGNTARNCPIGRVRSGIISLSSVHSLPAQQPTRVKGNAREIST